MPDLSPLLVAFKNRDHGTFMHSIAVHFTAQRLTNDLKMRLSQTNIRTEIWHELSLRSPFWMLHDIGKTAADIDMEEANSNVFPSYPDLRTNPQKASHWIHPQMSASIIKIWGEKLPKNLQPLTQKWAQLSYVHDNMLNPFLEDGHKIKLDYADKLSLLIFSLSDTAMAMGLPRPNKNCIYSPEQIKNALIRKYLSDNALRTMFPNQNVNELRNYILVSVLDSLDELQKKYPKSIWTKTSTQPNSEKMQVLDNLVVQSWTECQHLWEATVLRMDLAKVF